MLCRYQRRCDVIHLGDEPVCAPPAANDCVACSEHVIGHTEARIEIREPVWLATERNSSVDGMPIVSRSILSCIKVRQNTLRIKYRHADVVTVVPVAHMFDTGAYFQGQAVSRSPGVVHEDRCCLIGCVGNRGGVVLTVSGGYAHFEVSNRIVLRTEWVAGNDVRILTTKAGDVAVLIRGEGALVVVSVLGVSAHLNRVRSPYFGEHIVKLRRFLADRVLSRRVLKDGGLREVREGFRSCRTVCRNVQR